MTRSIDFTRGRILPALLRFALPVLMALFLQAMYGAVDLMVVGKFGQAADVSAVSTGSQIMMTLTNFVGSFAMVATVLLSQKLGEGRKDACAGVIGTSLLLFLAVGLVMTVLIPVGALPLARLMRAPLEAEDLTAAYIRICGAGSVAIIAYNLIGSIFRGLGDSKTPLITVGIACLCNIFGDLLLVAVFHLGAPGAAMATVFAQLLSVVFSWLLIRRKPLPVTFGRRDLRWDGGLVRRIVRIGTPIALQDLLVGASFLIILAIVNNLGLTQSAGVGVAEKVCAFIMLVPAAFMQSMSAFVGQNRGAGKPERAIKGLWAAVAVSFGFGVVMFWMAFFHGDLLSTIFARQGELIAASWDYLKAYAIDCLLTCFLFCFIGFFNGMERTAFVMVQGIIGAFAIRVPVCFYMSKLVPVSLFRIGLATPCSTVVQIGMCLGYLLYLKHRTDLFRSKEGT